MTTREKLAYMLEPYYKVHPPGRYVLTPDQTKLVRQSIRAIRPFTQSHGFREITKHDILMFPLLADREGQYFTASLLASLLSETHTFLVSRYVVNKILGGNLRRRKKTTSMIRRIKGLETRSENLEELVMRIVTGNLPKLTP